MERKLFRELYKRTRGLALKDCPPSSLSGLLHGYLSVYSMVRVYPWLEDEFEGPWGIHERVSDIARVTQELLKDTYASVNVRAGYVVDLMDSYLLYSDMSSLDVALDAAYEILASPGSGKMALPCRTPNVCRLLCNCYYFTGEEESGLLARSLVTEALGLSRKWSHDELFAWWDAIQVYECVTGGMDVPAEERERLFAERARLEVSVEQAEDECVERFLQADGSDHLPLMAEVFDVLARREFSAWNEFHGKKE